MQTSFDVVVVGGGGSGLAAAASAAEHGASVLLLEKQPQLGGTTGIAVGSFTANCTPYQRRAGIEDSIAAHDEDAGKFARPEIEARNNTALRRYFLGHAAETLHWLEGMGLRFHGPSPEPPNRVPRMHNVMPNAKAYVAALQSQLMRRGGTILCDAPVVRLVRDGARVGGVVARSCEQEVEFKAACGVVLAAGDYANDATTIARYKGQAFAAIEGINPNAGGDGHRLAQAGGAKLVNMDVTYGPELRFVPPPGKTFLQLLPASGPLARLAGWLLPLAPRALLDAATKRLLVTWQHPENALFDEGAILVNARGERFCNERQWPEREIAVAAQPGKIAYVLLDQRLAQYYSRWPHFISTAPEIAYAYVEDYLRLRPDVAVSAASLSELAAKRSLPAASLEAAICAYQIYVAGKSADPWGRTGDTAPLQTGRWVLLGPLKAYFTTTEGGAAINEQLQVLDDAGRPIDGLYAVGQNGLGGQILWGHGLHIAWAMTSGRLVGKLLAQQSRRR